jgi:KTSC domain-containing protein
MSLIIKVKKIPAASLTPSPSASVHFLILLLFLSAPILAYFFTIEVMPSTVISQIHYDAEARCLRITYTSGSIYEYLDVPEIVYKEMMTWQSKGAFLNNRIKKEYKYRKVNQDFQDL